jgi:RNA-directed DNA polymerase
VRGAASARGVGGQQRALTRMVMEEVASSANLNQAYKRVKANKGAAGVDGMSIAQLRPWIGENRERLIAALLDGSYQPNTVRGVEIPKPGGQPPPRNYRARKDRSPPSQRRVVETDRRYAASL